MMTRALRPLINNPYTLRLTILTALGIVIGAELLGIITLSIDAFLAAVFLVAFVLTDILHDYSPDTPDPLTREQRKAAASVPDRDVETDSILYGILNEDGAEHLRENPPENLPLHALEEPHQNPDEDENRFGFEFEFDSD